MPASSTPVDLKLRLWLLVVCLYFFLAIFWSFVHHDPFLAKGAALICVSGLLRARYLYLHWDVKDLAYKKPKEAKPFLIKNARL